MNRVQTLLLEFIADFHATGPKRESWEESRFILSHGCCHDVQKILTAVLQKEGMVVYHNGHCYHSWIEVDGIAYDSLCPLGYTGSVWQYWCIEEMFPGNQRPDPEARMSLPIDKVEQGYYIRLNVALSAFCGRYGVPVVRFQRKGHDWRAVYRIEQRYRRRIESVRREIIPTAPIPCPSAYFTDCVEEAVDRPLLPYPYPLSLSFYRSRFKDLRKKGTPIWQM